MRIAAVAAVNHGWDSKVRTFGLYSEGSNVMHMDGHAKYYKHSALVPTNQDEGTTPCGQSWSSADCGTSYNWWGTNYAAPNFR